MSYDKQYLNYWSGPYMEDYDDEDEDENYGEEEGLGIATSTSTARRDSNKSARAFEGQPWLFYHEADPDDTPRPEDDSSLAGILRNALIKTEPQLPFTGQEKSLPRNFKLEVDGVGAVTLPLNEEQASSVIGRSEFESNYKTLEKVWELGEEAVKIVDDAEWWDSLENLIQIVTTHLGLERISEDYGEVLVEPSHKLVLHSEGNVVLEAGGDDSIEGTPEAILIVPFSTSDGGVLVVDGTDGATTRHEMTQEGTEGKSFVVVPSGARCTVEDAQSGVHAALIFYFHLQESLAYLSVHPRNQDISKILSPAVEEVSALLYPTVLFLKNDYDSDVLAKSGTAALTGVDFSRLQTIQKLNDVLPPNKQLQVLAVRLDHEIKSESTGDSDCDAFVNDVHKDSIVWLTLGTKDQTFTRDPENDESLELGLLDPDDETLREMRTTHTSTVTMPSKEECQQFADRMRNARCREYDGPPMPTKQDRYSRHALLIFPRQCGTKIVQKFGGYVAAAVYHLQYASEDSAALRSLLTNGDYYTKEWNETVCHSLVKTKDTSLVDLFFEQVAGIFCAATRVDIESAILILIQGFGWRVIESPFLSCCSRVNDYEVLEALVHLARALPGHDDQKRILESIFNEATYWSPSCIVDYYEIDKLWNCASHCRDMTVFDSFVRELKRSGPDSYQCSDNAYLVSLFCTRYVVKALDISRCCAGHHKYLLLYDARRDDSLATIQMELGGLHRQLQREI